MIGLDTNVLVRYLVQDDRRQGRLAAKVIEDRLSSEDRGFIASIVLCEVVWVLKRAYGQLKVKLAEINRSKGSETTVSFDACARKTTALFSRAD